MTVIGHIKTPYREKFGIPRQAGLVDVAGVVEMLPGFDKPSMFDGLEAFSHVWLCFVFHQCVDQGWRERVRPPRLGGNQSMGVFATRSPFRPNHLGLSVVALEQVEVQQGRVRLQVRGADLLDGTPIVDIKPYLPYADVVEKARAGFAAEPPDPVLEVVYSAPAEACIRQLPDEARWRLMIEQLVGLDPRPAYQKAQESERVFGMRLEDMDIRWKVRGGQAIILAIEPAHESSQ